MSSKNEFNWTGIAVLLALFAGVVALAIYAIHLNAAKPAAEETTADCTGISIVVALQFVDKAAAKEAAGITTEQIKLVFYIWDSDDQRLELWLSDRVLIWQLEVLCFDKSKDHYPVYGEVQIVDLAKLAAKEENPLPLLTDFYQNILVN